MQNFNEDIKNKYYELVAIKRIGTYVAIAKYKNISVDVAKKSYKSIGSFIANELNLEFNEYENFIQQSEVVEKKNQIDKIFKNQFSGHKDRQGDNGFGSFENFYSQWYIKQGNKCFYCETTKENLEKLFHPQNGLEAKIKSTKFNATLHIEQIDPKKGYNKENCRLACSLCNNAKSDLISKENYVKYFASCMKKFLYDLNNTNLKNITY